MGHIDLIEKLKSLPAEQQDRISGLINFYLSRQAPASAPDAPDLDFPELSLAQAMRGMEDDPVIYKPEDLREKWR